MTAEDTSNNQNLFILFDELINLSAVVVNSCYQVTRIVRGNYIEVPDRTVHKMQSRVLSCDNVFCTANYCAIEGTVTSVKGLNAEVVPAEQYFLSAVAIEIVLHL